MSLKSRLYIFEQHPAHSDMKMFNVNGSLLASQVGVLTWGVDMKRKNPIALSPHVALHGQADTC